LSRLRTIALLTVAAISASSVAQGQRANQTFDSVSVKPSKSHAIPTASFSLGPEDDFTDARGSASFTNTPLIRYIAFAYKLNPDQFVAMQHHLPDWVISERFDIQAKTKKPDTPRDDYRLMMRAMLTEHFKMVVHAETNQVPVFAVMLEIPGKMGPALKRRQPDAFCSNTDSKHSHADFERPCGSNVPLPSGSNQRKMGGRDIMLETLVAGIKNWGNLGCPLIDRTGLTGKYDFTIEWTPGSHNAASLNSEFSDPNFLQALGEQLGLKVVSLKRLPISIVIDRIERPSKD
jgi:uncharacterized protein (TIGR03435 family)